MRAGRLRHRVTLQQENATADASGQLIPDWKAVKKNLHAWVREVAGQEGRRGLQVDATTTHLVDVRYSTTYTPQRRFLWGTRILNIVKTLDTTGLAREQTIECREAV